MRRATGPLAIFTMLFFIGIGNLLRYAETVRFVDLAGISGSGASIGAALVGIVGCCLVFSGKLRLADKKPAEEIRPVPITRTQ